MKLLKFTRYSEWWEYKLIPLLTVGYATVLVNNYPIEKVALRILFLLFAIISGAVYVSVINDMTDIKEDAKAGKSNRMASLSPILRFSILGICLLIGAVFGYFIYPDALALLFFILAYVVFTLYSTPPIRLKKRGVWGLLCDATGAHLFPALVMTANLFFFLGLKINVFWIIAIAIWALMYGLRGILWHQFYDRDNDIKSETKTFAVSIKPENFKLQERFIFFIEIAAFSFIIYSLFNFWILLGILFYVLLVLIRKFSFKYETTIIISPKSAPYQLLMNDFYLVFFPISLLLTATISNQYGWVILLIHIVLFPQKLIFVVKDFFYFTRTFFHKNN